MHRGYIALWRKIEDHPFYNEPRVFSKYEAWLDLLRDAQHEKEPKKVVIGMTVLTCHYGELLRSIRTYARQWNWSEAKVRRFLKLLKKMGQIDYKSEGKTTRIIIINYALYDPRRRKGDAEATRERNTSDAQPTTDNNGNNEKNVNKNISPYGDMSPESHPETSSGSGSGVESGSNQSPSAKEKKTTPNCPQEDIKAIYHEELPELPSIRVWGEASQKNLRARWREAPERQSLEWWRKFFRDFIRPSDFLMGRKTDFLASLDWIAKPQNFQKIMNGNYVNRNGKRRRIEADQIDFHKKYEEFDDFDDFDVAGGNYA